MDSEIQNTTSSSSTSSSSSSSSSSSTSTGNIRKNTLSGSNTTPSIGLHTHEVGAEVWVWSKDSLGVATQRRHAIVAYRNESTDKSASTYDVVFGDCQEEAEVDATRVTHIEPADGLLVMGCRARLVTALVEKERGNACFQKKDLIEAERCYLRAIRLLAVTCGGDDHTRSGDAGGDGANDGDSGNYGSGGGNAGGRNIDPRLWQCGAAVRAPMATPPLPSSAHSLVLRGEGEGEAGAAQEEGVGDPYRLYPATVAFVDEEDGTIDVCFDQVAHRPLKI
jgi:hypothetical protein